MITFFNKKKEASTLELLNLKNIINIFIVFNQLYNKNFNCILGIINFMLICFLIFDFLF